MALRGKSPDSLLLFAQPRLVIEAKTLTDVLPALARLEQHVEGEGLHAAGFISYEAARAFDFSLTTRPPDAFPLLWFGLFDRPECAALPDSPSSCGDEPTWHPEMSETEHGRSVQRVRDYIARGDTYQVNLTFRLRARLTEDPWEYFLRLAASHRPRYGAFVDTGEWAVCSFSPELFFELNGEAILSKPMKGTAGRGLTREDDLRRAGDLSVSHKERAENVMILDMMRNDFGRLAAPGSVEVNELFSIEQHSNVWQMTSTVSARTTAGIPDIFSALFPPSSITGAPKKRTMEIIAELETSPRRLYTGCIGHIAPNRKAGFNVAIRTVLIDKRDGQAEFGVGGGIVWDSTERAEFEECLAKARVLKPAPRPFQLLETLLWHPESKYWLLDYHAERLADSAAYFAFPFNPEDLKTQLNAVASAFAGEPQRVRVLLEAAGALTCQSCPLAGIPPAPQRVCIAPLRANSNDPMRYHKTTCRSFSSKALAQCSGFDDAIFLNERGEVTESSIANVVVRIGGMLVTPPVSCGLLPGVQRRHMLARGEVTERVLHEADLRNSEEIYLVNSLRGAWRTILE